MIFLIIFFIFQLIVKLRYEGTFGDMLGFNPHLHIICADGCFGDNGNFYPAAVNLDATSLEPLFAHNILSMLKRRGLICKFVIEFAHGAIPALMYTQV